MDNKNVLQEIVNRVKHNSLNISKKQKDLSNLKRIYHELEEHPTHFESNNLNTEQKLNLLNTSIKVVQLSYQNGNNNKMLNRNMKELYHIAKVMNDSSQDDYLQSLMLAGVDGNNLILIEPKEYINPDYDQMKSGQKQKDSFYIVMHDARSNSDENNRVIRLNQQANIVWSICVNLLCMAIIPK